MATKLSEAEIKDKLAHLKGWTLEKGELTHTFQLPSFPAALVFVNAVGHMAEVAGHHPDIVIKYNKVTFALATHDAGGLTDKDFALAEQISKLPMPK